MSAIDEIDAIVKTFKNSAPVFVRILSPDKTRLELALKDKYNPKDELVDNGDPIKAIVADYYREDYDHSINKFSTQIRSSYVYQEVFRKIKEFYTETSKLKNPKQSGLYRWLNSIQERYNDDLSSGFLSLYRYVHTVSARQKDDEHVLNVHAILHLMMEKHGSNIARR